MTGRPRALITGVTGQDGSYLAELLIAKGYEVHAVIRRSSTFSTGRVEHLYQDVHEEGRALNLHYGDLLDTGSLVSVLGKVEPDEVYNLGAQSHVAVSFQMPEFTADAVAFGTMRLLEAIRQTGRPVRFYQAGSSEMFGKVESPLQNEDTRFHPRSPYAIAKVFAHQMAVFHREAYGMYCANGILFNHESPRRGEVFVTRKITQAVARIAAGRQDHLYLGNLKAKRDWGYAPEYVEAMWRILQQPEPDDFVIATGETHSVEEFAALAFASVGRRWQEHVRYDPRYERPAEVDLLQGDASKAERVLRWKARTTFADLARIMVAADLRAEGLDPDSVMRHD
ncbi:MAG: GDP-mannose 4,6-dehydratase [Dehalococcoidia bacterium]|nr:GDP-mannose 4,6-dehydratase [Dehalococcoidia bacterium]